MKITYQLLKTHSYSYVKDKHQPKNIPLQKPNRWVLGCPLEIQFYLEIFKIYPNN